MADAYNPYQEVEVLQHKIDAIQYNLTAMGKSRKRNYYVER